MKKLSIILSLFVSFLLINCNSQETKDKINKVGDATGQAVGEFTSGVVEGVEKAFEPKIDMSVKLKEDGMTFGKIKVENSGGTDNLLVVYMIFNKDFTGDITAKISDRSGLEMGRVKISLNQKKGDAKYIEFLFDKRTNIDKDSKIVIE